jgi:hypothetical protein
MESEMKINASKDCHRPGCANPIPPALACSQLCLDHFLDEASVRAEQALAHCQSGEPLQQEDLEWLLSDALATVQHLEAGADEPDANQRDRMLELVLSLANLQEYAAHHSIPVKRLA